MFSELFWVRSATGVKRIGVDPRCRYPALCLRSRMPLIEVRDYHYDPARMDAYRVSAAEAGIRRNHCSRSDRHHYNFACNPKERRW